MREIAPGVYLATKYHGVNAGVVVKPQGTLYVDTPPCPDQARAWRATVQALGQGLERLLVYLDHQVDRTLGGRVLECPIVVQEKTFQIFRHRPAVFRAQPQGRGEAWELCSAIGNMRWAQPSMAFGQQMNLYWDDEPIVLEHRPGPAPGAVWVILPTTRLVFVGDAVTLREPPFLAQADLEAWLAQLDTLLGKDFRDFIVVSARGGVVPEGAVRHMRRFLAEVRKRLQALVDKQAPPEATEDLVPKLLAWWEFDPTYDELYTQRLTYGLQAYYRAHYGFEDAEVEADEAGPLSDEDIDLADVDE